MSKLQRFHEPPSEVWQLQQDKSKQQLLFTQEELYVKCNGWNIFIHIEHRKAEWVSKITVTSLCSHYTTPYQVFCLRSNSCLLASSPSSSQACSSESQGNNFWEIGCKTLEESLLNCAKNITTNHEHAHRVFTTSTLNKVLELLVRILYIPFLICSELPHNRNNVYWLLATDYRSFSLFLRVK